MDSTQLVLCGLFVLSATLAAMGHSANSKPLKAIGSCGALTAMAALVLHTLG